MRGKYTSHQVRLEDGSFLTVCGADLRIMKIIIAHPGLSVQEITTRLPFSNRNIYRRLGKLAQAGLLKRVKIKDVSVYRFYPGKRYKEINVINISSSRYESPDKEQGSIKRVVKENQVLSEIDGRLFQFTDLAWSVYEHISNMTRKDLAATRKTYVNEFGELDRSSWFAVVEKLQTAKLIQLTNPEDVKNGIRHQFQATKVNVIIDYPVSSL